MVHTSGIERDTNPARTINVFRKPSTSIRAFIMGLIKNKPPPIPIERIPNANERLLTKYLGVMKYGGKNTKDEPNPKMTPYVSMIRSMLFTCEVSNRPLEQMKAPIITVTRAPNRLKTLATNVLKIPRPTIASDPTNAEEKKKLFLRPIFIVTVFEHIILLRKYNKP